MPQVKRQVEQNNFSGGFNTDQSPLNADPSTTIAEQNVILASDGSRARRYGIGTETSTGQAFAAPSDPAGTEHLALDNFIFQFNNIPSKTTAAGSVFETYDYTFVTLPQLNNRSYAVYRNTDAEVFSSLSFGPGNVLANGDSIRSLKSSSWGTYMATPRFVNQIELWRAQSDTAVNGILTSTLANIHIRDLFGVEDGLATTDRPATLTERHAYNLLNQGWTPDAIAKFNTEIGDFPSNADASYFGLVPDLNSGASPPPYLYDAETLKTFPFPSGAPKGNFFISLGDPNGTRRGPVVAAEFTALNTLLGTSLSTTNLPANKNANWYVSSVETFLGRFFYSGQIVGADNYNSDDDFNVTPSIKNGLFFTRVLETVEQDAPTGGDINSGADLANPHRCGSTINPTQENFTPTATDGGFLFVDGAETILATYALRDSLLIVATNGVWELRAQDGFTPSTFILSKILSAVIQDTRGVIEQNSVLFIPAKDGIYALSYDGESRRTIAQNITQAKVNTYYTNKWKWVVDGAYDQATNEFRWLLRTPPVYTDGTTGVTIEQEELVLDATLGSFCKNTYPSCVAPVRLDTRQNTLSAILPYYSYQRDTPGRPNSGNFLVGYVNPQNTKELATPVTPIDYKRDRIDLRFCAFDQDNDEVLSIARQYRDFQDFGQTVSGFIMSPPVTLGDTVRNKDLTYLWTHFYRTEDGFTDPGSGDWVPTNESGALLSVRWDFSDSTNSGKFSESSQVYRLNRDYLPEDLSDPFDYGQNIITTKNNVRGTGKALSIRIESDEDKDFQLIGWGAEINVNGAV